MRLGIEGSSVDTFVFADLDIVVTDFGIASCNRWFVEMFQSIAFDIVDFDYNIVVVAVVIADNFVDNPVDIVAVVGNRASDWKILKEFVDIVNCNFEWDMFVVIVDIVGILVIADNVVAVVAVAAAVAAVVLPELVLVVLDMMEKIALVAFQKSFATYQVDALVFLFQMHSHYFCMIDLNNY